MGVNPTFTINDAINLKKCNRTVLVVDGIYEVTPAEKLRNGTYEPYNVSFRYWDGDQPVFSQAKYPGNSLYLSAATFVRQKG